MTAIEHARPAGMPLAPVDFSQTQIDLIKNQIAPGASDGELHLFIEQCRRTGLDPFSRQIYAVMREQSVKQGNQWVKVQKMTIQVSIDGFRVIAERHGQYAGRVGPYWCGPDGQWVDVWLQQGPPAAAKVGILRHGFTEPLWAVARFEAYASRKQDGALMGLWAKMPDVMIAKCAEAQALRSAFPNDLSGLYTGDEMAQADNPREEGRPTPEAQQGSRRADVTREVQQAAGTPAHTTQPAPQAPNATALQRVRDMAQRVQQYGAERVEEILGRHDWQSDMSAAAAAYSDLKDFGLEQAALLKAREQAQPAPQEDVQDGQFTPDPSPITNDQIGQLQSAARGMNADSSEIRAAVWAWILQRPAPVNTTVLTAQDAADVLAYLAKCSPEQRIQATAEAMRVFDIPELPF